jgi:hypothetical protein
LEYAAATPQSALLYVAVWHFYVLLQPMLDLLADGADAASRRRCGTVVTNDSKLAKNKFT